MGFCLQKQNFSVILFTETKTKFMRDCVYRKKISAGICLQKQNFDEILFTVRKLLKDSVYKYRISVGICLQKQNFNEILSAVRKLLKDTVHKYRISAGICSNKQTLWNSIHRSTISPSFLFSQKKTFLWIFAKKKLNFCGVHSSQ